MKNAPMLKRQIRALPGSQKLTVIFQRIEDNDMNESEIEEWISVLDAAYAAGVESGKHSASNSR